MERNMCRRNNAQRSAVYDISQRGRFSDILNIEFFKKKNMQINKM